MNDICSFENALTIHIAEKQTVTNKLKYIIITKVNLQVFLIKTLKTRHRNYFHS